VWAFGRCVQNDYGLNLQKGILMTPEKLNKNDLLDNLGSREGEGYSGSIAQARGRVV